MRGRTGFFLLLLALIWSEYTWAATDQSNKHVIQLSPGMMYFESHDELGSPLIYRGLKAAMTVSYLYQGVHNRHEFRIGFTAGELKPRSKFPNQSADHWFVHVQYGNVRRIATSRDGKIGLFVGGMSDNRASVKDFHTSISNFRGTPGELDNQTGTAFFSFNLRIFSEYRPHPRRRVQVSAAFPLIVYAVRTHYTITDRVSQWSRFGSYRHVDLACAFVQQFSRSFELGARYRFDYTQYNLPEKTDTVWNGLSLDLLFTF